MSIADLFDARIIFGDFGQFVRYLSVFVPVSLLTSFYMSCVIGFFNELLQMLLGGRGRGRR